MSDQVTMERMAAEALQELDLDFGIMNCFAPPDAAHEWCIDFSDPSAAQGSHVFQVCVQWGEGSYDSVKTDLKRKIEATRPRGT